MVENANIIAQGQAREANLAKLMAELVFFPESDARRNIFFESTLSALNKYSDKSPKFQLIPKGEISPRLAVNALFENLKQCNPNQEKLEQIIMRGIITELDRNQVLEKFTDIVLNTTSLKPEHKNEFIRLNSEYHFESLPNDNQEFKKLLISPDINKFSIAYALANNSNLTGKEAKDFRIRVIRCIADCDDPKEKEQLVTLVMYADKLSQNEPTYMRMLFKDAAVSETSIDLKKLMTLAVMLSKQDMQEKVLEHNLSVVYTLLKHSEDSTHPKNQQVIDGIKKIISERFGESYNDFYQAASTAERNDVLKKVVNKIASHKGARETIDEETEAAVKYANLDAVAYSAGAFLDMATPEVASSGTEESSSSSDSEKNVIEVSEAAALGTFLLLPIIANQIQSKTSHIRNARNDFYAAIGKLSSEQITSIIDQKPDNQSISEAVLNYVKNKQVKDVRDDTMFSGAAISLLTGGIITIVFPPAGLAIAAAGIAATFGAAYINSRLIKSEIQKAIDTDPKRIEALISKKIEEDHYKMPDLKSHHALHETLHKSQRPLLGLYLGAKTVAISLAFVGTVAVSNIGAPLIMSVAVVMQAVSMAKAVTLYQHLIKNPGEARKLEEHKFDNIHKGLFGSKNSSGRRGFVNSEFDLYLLNILKSNNEHDNENVKQIAGDLRAKYSITSSAPGKALLSIGLDTGYFTEKLLLADFKEQLRDPKLRNDGRSLEESLATDCRNKMQNTVLSSYIKKNLAQHVEDHKEDKDVKELASGLPNNAAEVEQVILKKHLDDVKNKYLDEQTASSLSGMLSGQVIRTDLIVAVATLVMGLIFSPVGPIIIGAAAGLFVVGAIASVAVKYYAQRQMKQAIIKANSTQTTPASSHRASTQSIQKSRSLDSISTNIPLSPKSPSRFSSLFKLFRKKTIQDSSSPAATSVSTPASSPTSKRHI